MGSPCLAPGKVPTGCRGVCAKVLGQEVGRHLGGVEGMAVGWRRSHRPGSDADGQQVRWDQSGPLAAAGPAGVYWGEEQGKGCC
jgi:hypothetical protein